MAKNSTVSIVIPVFNEERLIRGCLEAIALQTVMPDEVVVVDNNCSDHTVQIAKQFDFVRIVNEQKQGRGNARTKGFNEAKSDIIGRIDADSRIDKEWVKIVKEQFESDPELVGVTGLGLTSFLPFLQSPKSTMFSRVYFWFVHASFRTVTMWGANMAIRRSAWLEVADRVCNDDKIVHEDQDVSLWLAANGGKIEQNNAMRITTGGQSYRYLPKFVHYNRLFWSTKKMHKNVGNLEKFAYKLSFVETLPGRVASVGLGVLLLAQSILLFPIDYLIAKKLRNKAWLD